jgi:hypothetical protein
MPRLREVRISQRYGCRIHDAYLTSSIDPQTAEGAENIREDLADSWCADEALWFPTTLGMGIKIQASVV